MDALQTRRGFLSSAASLAGTGLLAPLGAARAEAVASASDPDPSSPSGPVFVSTWPFGRAANETAATTLGQGGLLDAVEQGIRLVEADPEEHSVGLGGTPNADGVVQLDACFMDGEGQRAGSVAALEGIEHPISVARRVMEVTPHVMLVGEGARRFALAQGFESADLLTEDRRERWEAWRREQQGPPPLSESHDTIALLGRCGDGRLAGGCSTSGWGYKLAGRVGDSPIVGGGLYVDGEVGGAGATGLGENIMRYCGSYRVVDLMARGADPQSACVEAVRHILGRDPRPADQLSCFFIALDKQGRTGAAGTSGGFSYCVTTDTGSRLIDAEVVTS